MPRPYDSMVLISSPVRTYSGHGGRLRMEQAGLRPEGAQGRDDARGKRPAGLNPKPIVIRKEPAGRMICAWGDHRLPLRG